jgi:hypothetical protein
VLAACLDGPLQADKLAATIAREALPVRLQPVASPRVASHAPMLQRRAGVWTERS